MKVILHNAFVIVIVILGMSIATFLGINGQDLSYAVNDRYPDITLTTAITIVTCLSIGLYLAQPFIVVKFLKLKRIYLITGIIACAFIALPISLFTFFVWAAWMG
ncbi:hypothetical protein HNO89_000906 [Sporosarcina luteola]|nr:hypothetical protein [Sporosarcina luteola]